MPTFAAIEAGAPYTVLGSVTVDPAKREAPREPRKRLVGHAERMGCPDYDPARHANPWPAVADLLGTSRTKLFAQARGRGTPLRRAGRMYGFTAFTTVSVEALKASLAPPPRTPAKPDLRPGDVAPVPPADELRQALLAQRKRLFGKLAGT
jgi:hypothetical protein